VGLPLAPLALSKRTMGMPVSVALSDAEKLPTLSQLAPESVLFHSPFLRDPK